MTKSHAEKGHCPDCGPERNADCVASHLDEFSDDTNPIWGSTDYRILKCRGCGSIYFKTVVVFSEASDYRFNNQTNEWETYYPEDVSYWPAPTKRIEPEWTRILHRDYRQIDALLDDVYSTLNADLAVPAAIATRTTFDAASEQLGIDPALNFSEKLDALFMGGYIGAGEKVSLFVLADAGGAAAHRGWKPSPKQLDTMVSILEAFLHREFVLKAQASELKQDIPARPRRKKQPASTK